MKEEYIVISKTAIQKRIEELKKPIAHHDGIYVSERQIAEYESLEEILSQSTPLIPEIEKAFDKGRIKGVYAKVGFEFIDRKDYITNLKLDI